MELRHLRYFVAVAEELHFGRAAERLFMAQPPLSQQIKQLETEMGVTLFRRTNRRVELTESGRVFLDDARTVLERVDQAVQRARRVHRGEQGWLGIGFVASATYGALPEILRRFRGLYPDVELELLELFGGEQGDALRRNRIHVGFSRLPGEEKDLVLEAIAREPLLAALPAAHRLTARAEIPLRDLAEEPFIQFPPSPQSHYAVYINSICQAAGFAPRVEQKTGDIETAISLVAAGIGIALVPESVRSLRRDSVVYRPLAAPAPVIELVMAYRLDDPSPVLPRFLEIARETVREREAA